MAALALLWDSNTTNHKWHYKRKDQANSLREIYNEDEIPHEARLVRTYFSCSFFLFALFVKCTSAPLHIHGIQLQVHADPQYYYDIDREVIMS